MALCHLLLTIICSDCFAIHSEVLSQSPSASQPQPEQQPAVPGLTHPLPSLPFPLLQTLSASRLLMILVLFAIALSFLSAQLLSFHARLAFDAPFLLVKP